MNLPDYRGVGIRLTDERPAHILARREMRAMTPERVAETLREPELVVLSKGDPDARLYYKRYVDTPVGDKHLCVIVAQKAGDPFVLTAYLTGSVKSGEVVWPARS